MFRDNDKNEAKKKRATQLGDWASQAASRGDFAKALRYLRKGMEENIPNATAGAFIKHHSNYGETIHGKTIHAEVTGFYKPKMNDPYYSNFYYSDHYSSDHYSLYYKLQGYLQIEFYEKVIAEGDTNSTYERALYGRASLYFHGSGEKNGKSNYAKALPLFLKLLSRTKNPELIKQTKWMTQLCSDYPRARKLPVNLVFQLLNTEQLTDVLSTRIGYFNHRKLDLVAYFRTLPEPEQFEAVKKSLDKSHLLGKLFALPEDIIDSFRSIFGATDPLKEGTLLNEVYKLFTQLDEKRKQAASPSSTNTISESLSGAASPTTLTIRPQQPPIASYELPNASALLEPVFIKNKYLNDPDMVSALSESLQTAPSAPYSFMLTNELNTVAYAAVPLSPPRERMAFQPFFFTNEMNHLPSVANLPPLPASRSTSETETQQRTAVQLF